MLCRLPERLQEVGGGREGKGTGGLCWGGGLCLRGTTLHPISKHFCEKGKPSPNNAVQQFFGICFFTPHPRLLPHLPFKALYTTPCFYKGFITRNTADFQQMRERRNILKWPTPQYIFFSLQFMILLLPLLPSLWKPKEGLR